MRIGRDAPAVEKTYGARTKGKALLIDTDSDFMSDDLLAGNFIIM